MKAINLVCGLVLTGSFVTSAFGNPLIPNKLKKQMQENKTSGAGDNDCTDFTGNWVGVCVDSGDDAGGSYEDTLVIKQDEYNRCSEIYMHGLNLSIGGSTAQTQTDAASGWTNHLQAYPDWNSGRTELHTRYHFNSRKLNERAYMTVEGQSKVKLVGDQLEIFTRLSLQLEQSGSTTNFSGWTECTYQRAK